MMGHRVKMVSGDEYDALTKDYNLLNWRPGQRKAIKRCFNKRQRRAVHLWLSTHTNNTNQNERRR